jgi:hypothetical protein
VWLPEDQQAALEWQAHKDLLCSGCGQPRDECFAPENSFRYTAEPLECHACAARERKKWARNKNREAKDPPEFGMYYSVTLDPEEV